MAARRTLLPRDAGRRERYDPPLQSARAAAASTVSDTRLARRRHIAAAGRAATARSSMPLHPHRRLPAASGHAPAQASERAPSPARSSGHLCRTTSCLRTTRGRRRRCARGRPRSARWSSPLRTTAFRSSFRSVDCPRARVREIGREHARLGEIRLSTAPATATLSTRPSGSTPSSEALDAE